MKVTVNITFPLELDVENSVEARDMLEEVAPEELIIMAYNDGVTPWVSVD